VAVECQLKAYWLVIRFFCPSIPVEINIFVNQLIIIHKACGIHDKKFGNLVFSGTQLIGFVGAK
jgi:hypothetical protein